MTTRLRRADSTSGKLLEKPAKALLVMLAFVMPAPLYAQSAEPTGDQSAEQSAEQTPAGTYSLLYSFKCAPDGESPESGLIGDSSGNLYGTTTRGGYTANNGDSYGIVFKIAPDGTESVLHRFVGRPSDGGFPSTGSLALDAAGNLYGATGGGGSAGYGTVFKLTPTGTETILYSFCQQSHCADGSGPVGVVLDSSGNLYGATEGGDPRNDGIVFKLTPSGKETVLHSFGAVSTDGRTPTSNLAQDSSGNLYGTTENGGTYNAGTIFEVAPSGGSGDDSIVHSFMGYPSDGKFPYGGGFLRDASGNFYGVTLYGGPYLGYGMVFKFTPATDTESVLFNLPGGNGGANPVDGLAMDAAGNLYGTTVYACSGSADYVCATGGGVLFKVSPAGTETVLHEFTQDLTSDGANPYGGVLRDKSGNLYGTLSTGGANACGAVFKYTP